MRTGDWLGPCGYCGKMVRLKAFFGTLHICADVNERAAIDKAEWMMQQQMRSKPINVLDSLCGGKP